MIPANELRIGNFVNGSKDGGIICVTARIIFSVDANESIFKPIPLTPEILENWCGFSPFFESNKQYHFRLGQVGLCFNKNRPEFGWYLVKTEIRWVNVKYLHQLQNLYWCLTGKELEINF